MLSSTLMRRWRHFVHYQARQLTTAGLERQHNEPLRILFCGSDDFSIASLRALHRYSKDADSRILSIDVAAKKDKLTGRGLKKLKAPMIKSVAEELGLRLHQFDTFTGWSPPLYSSLPVPNINLIIAVSFGLLIPARIIAGATFGGLNVHPSLLPDLRGAAPLNWAIIRGYSHTGVSVQTLHPTRFDEGVVLAQTEPISMPPNAQIHELRELVSPVGANLLVETLKNKLYLQPHVSVARTGDTMTNMAPKILAHTKQFTPLVDDLQTILRKNRAVPKLFAYATTLKSNGTISQVRILFGTNMKEAEPGVLPFDVVSQVQVGIPFAVTKAGSDPSKEPSPVYVVCKDQKVLEISLLLVEGRKECAASQAAVAGGILGQPFEFNGCSIHPFRGLSPEARV